MSKSKIIWLLLLVLLKADLHAQEHVVLSHFDSLLCKEWKLDKVEQNNKTTVLSDAQKNSRITYYANHEIKTLNGNLLESGKWLYDSSTKNLTLFDKGSKIITAKFEVRKIDSNQLIISVVSNKAVSIIINLIPSEIKN